LSACSRLGLQSADRLLRLVKLRLDRRDLFPRRRPQRFHLLSGLFVEQAPELPAEAHQPGDRGFRQFHRLPLLWRRLPPLVQIALHRRIAAPADPFLHVQDGRRRALIRQGLRHLENTLLRHQSLSHDRMSLK
jgi:hypothetical protein